MSTQIIERERVKYDEEFLRLLKNIGIEIPKQFLYVKAVDDDE